MASAAARVATSSCWRQCAFSSSRPALAARAAALRSAGGYGGRRTFVSSSSLLEKKYSEAHEWVELSPDGKTGTVGVSTYAAKQLGDVVFVELPAADLEVSAGDALGAVESVKSASDIYAPVSGKVIETNAALEEKPGTINKSPEQDGWIAKLEVSEGVQAELEELMDEAKYAAFTKPE